MAKPVLLLLGLGLILTACAPRELAPLTRFSTCNQTRMQDHMQWCLASDNNRNFHRTVGRHYIIYGRYNDLPAMTKDGVSRCQLDQAGQRDVNACTPAKVMDLAMQYLTEPKGIYCEAEVDPRQSLVGC